MTIEATYANAGWDISDDEEDQTVWLITALDNDGYPLLLWSKGL